MSYAENAVAWALQHLGSTSYPARCLSFVEDAYEDSNHIEIFGGSCALESAEEYGVTRDPDLPPLGAFVFYDCHGPVEGQDQNWGHVGLSLGDGRVVHAWGQVRIDHYLEIQNLTPPAGWTQPTYMGWTPSSRILKGAIGGQ